MQPYTHSVYVHVRPLRNSWAKPCMSGFCKYTYTTVCQYLCLICSDAKHAISYYTLSDGDQTILPAEAMEAQNPYPFGIDPVNSLFTYVFSTTPCVYFVDLATSRQ